MFGGRFGGFPDSTRGGLIEPCFFYSLTESFVFVFSGKFTEQSTFVINHTQSDKIKKIHTSLMKKKKEAKSPDPSRALSAPNLEKQNTSSVHYIKQKLSINKSEVCRRKTVIGQGNFGQV